MARSGSSRAAVWVGGLFLLAAFGHAVYPALLALRTRRLADPQPPGGPLPALAVVIAAYREAAVIEAKVASVLADGYPGALEIVVVTEDEATRDAAARTPARVVFSQERLGKALAINLGVESTSAPVIVLTDANNELVPGSLQRLARWFADPEIGAVAGEKRVETDGGEGAFWRFESWLKRREARTGTTIGLVGELAAVRRSLFQPLPAVAVDDLWLTLDLLERRARIAYEPLAATVEPPQPPGAELERRTRIVAGVLDLLWRRRALLLPGRADATLQLWGHRALRLSLGPLAHLVLLARGLRRARHSGFWALFLAGHAVGGAALVRMVRGDRQGRGAALLAQVLFLQMTALAGIWRYVRGDRPAIWTKPERRPPPADAGTHDLADAAETP